MRVCDVFNVYLHTNTTRLSQRSIYIRVGSILVYIRNTKNHVPHTFRTHSRLEIVWDQTYMRLWWWGIKHRHVQYMLLVTRHICVCLIFCDIASKLRVCNQTLHTPQKSPKSTREPMRCILHVVRRAHIVVCLLSLGCLRPQATKYPTMSSIFLIWRSVERSVSHSVCRNQYGKRCAAAACAWAS